VAKKLKETVDYFPFFVKDGKTSFLLKKKYGLAGIGFFTELMRWLSQTPKHYYSFNDEYDKLRIIEYIGVSEKEIESMLYDVASTDKIDYELWHGYRIIISKDFIESLTEAYKRRASSIPTFDEIKQEIKQSYSKVSAICTQYAENMQETCSIKKRKEKESKEKKSKKEESKDVATVETVAQQKVLFNAAKTCFENSPRAKAMIFKDKNTSGMQMKKLKDLTEACIKIEPNFPSEFLLSVLEHFRVLTNGKLKGKAEFTPRSLSTPWIWEMVIGSLPDNEGISEELLNNIRGLFK